MGIGAGFAAIAAGIADAVASVGTFFAGVGGAIAGGVGLGGATIGGIGAGALIGGGLEGAAIGGLGGAGLSAIEGKPVLTGALEGAAGGALTGGLTAGIGGGLAGEAGSSLGIGASAGDVLAGAGVGAAGAAAFGGNPLTGALTGGVGEGLSLAAGSAGSAGSASGPAGTAPATAEGGGVGGPGGGAVATAAPASVAGGDTGTVGAALAASDPSAAAAAGGGGAELAGPDAAALQGGLAASQASGTNQVGAAVAGSPDSSGAAAPTAGGFTTADVAPLPNAPAGTPTPPIPPMLDASGNPVADASGNAVYPSSAQATDALAQGTASAAGYPAPATAGSTNWSNFSNEPFGTVGSALANNAGWLAPVAGLGLAAGKDLLSSTPSSTGLESTLQGQANTLGANSAQLESYLQTGTLPAGVQNSINSAAKSAQASIRSQYAARGMSGSSAEAADLQAVQTNASSQGANIAMQLLQTGVTEANLSDQIYGQLLSASIAQDNALSAAVGNFASSMVPKPSTNVTITQGA